MRYDSIQDRGRILQDLVQDAELLGGVYVDISHGAGRRGVAC